MVTFLGFKGHGKLSFDNAGVMFRSCSGANVLFNAGLIAVATNMVKTIIDRL